MLVEIVIVVALVVLNGFLAMSELAVVSARPVRLKILEDAGSRGAAVAGRLARAPGRFISTVQIGITLVGVLSGAFSGATLGQRLALGLEARGVEPALADALGVGAVVIAITYLSLVVGELVPKQIALRDPERVAAKVAPVMLVLSRFGAPLVFLLDVSGRTVLRLLGQSGRVDDTVTEEEVRSVIAEATSAGVIESEERSMIAGVMRLADRAARGLMTPRREVEMIDLTDPPEEIDRLLRTTRRSRLPVHEEEPDAVIGVIIVREVLAANTGDVRAGVRAALRPAPVVRDGSPALDVVRALRGNPVHLALVFDEYGHFEGIVTAGDVLEAITGVFLDEDTAEPAIVHREDGSFLVSGWMPVDEFADLVGFPIRDDINFETVAGLVLDHLNRLPEVGERFAVGEWRVEVVDLDGRRIDKVIVSRASAVVATTHG